MKYKILRSIDHKDLEEAVNRYLESGWTLSGTLQSFYMAGNCMFIQALTKE